MQASLIYVIHYHRLPLPDASKMCDMCVITGMLLNHLDESGLKGVEKTIFSKFLIKCS